MMDLIKKTMGFCLLCVSTTFATTYTVDDDGKADFSTIQAAIDVAVDGDEITVLDGIYNELINFNGKAILLKSANGALTTTIDGQNLGGTIVRFQTDENSESVIDGFTITNGSAEFDAGGLYCLMTSPTIKNCIISLCTAVKGGGIYNNQGTPHLEGCVFINNYATSAGGGVCCSNGTLTLTDCSFTSNSAISAGAIRLESNSNSVITNCEFNSNTAMGEHGGAIYAHQSEATFFNCSFMGNIANLGGAIITAQQPIYIEQCYFGDNIAENGGALFLNENNAYVSNTEFCNNTPQDWYGYSGNEFIDEGGNEFSEFCWPDCNNNGIDDLIDIANQTSMDCDQNSVPDECQPDCDEDGLIDPCDIAYGGESDYNSNGIPDNCEPDCNENGLPDDFEIEQGIAQDCNENGVPDDCDSADDPSMDCDGNGAIDSCEIEADPSIDCNENGIIDSCELVGQIPEGAVQWTIEEGGNGHWYLLVLGEHTWEESFVQAESYGGYLATLTSSEEKSFVWNYVNQTSSCSRPWLGGFQNTSSPDYSEPNGGWEWITGEQWSYTNWQSGEPNNANGDQNWILCWSDCTGTYADGSDTHAVEFAVEWDELPVSSIDCNSNNILDECDIADGTSTDVNSNGIPDECETDCNTNGVPDLWEIKKGQASDCNLNSIPDDCDIADGTSNDINANAIPDECEDDCNGNGVPDSWDIKTGAATDCNTNFIPDSCDIEGECELDCNMNGLPDTCDIASGESADVNLNGVPDECECIADVNGDEVVNVNDILAIVGYWGTAGPLGDINGDAMVDVVDLLLIVNYWGVCPEDPCPDVPPMEGAVQWTIEEGGNGHWYLVVLGDYTWQEGSDYANSVGGHLATLTSAEENDWVVSFMASATNPWIGGYQDLNAPDYTEPAGGWRWVTGEEWSYTNWGSSEPNNQGGEHWIQIGNSAGFWNDWGKSNIADSVIEWSD